MKMCGGDNCNIYNSNSVNLDEIFERISMDVGIRQETDLIGVANEQAAVLYMQ